MDLENITVNSFLQLGTEFLKTADKINSLDIAFFSNVISFLKYYVSIINRDIKYTEKNEETDCFVEKKSSYEIKIFLI